LLKSIQFVVWHVWQKQEPSRDTTPKAIQRKYTRWAYTHRLARSHGFTAKQFSELMMSKINLTSVPQTMASQISVAPTLRCYQVSSIGRLFSIFLLKE
jgi:hypothetical protein